MAFRKDPKQYRLNSDELTAIKKLRTLNYRIMKLLSLKPIAFVLLVLFAAVGTQAQKASTLKSHKVTVDGTSSLHDFTSDVTKVTWAGSVVTEGKAVKSISNVTVTINVESIKSTKGDTMDEKNLRSLQLKEEPNHCFQADQSHHQR